MRRRIVAWILGLFVITLITSYATVSFATSISTFLTDETTGWTKWDDRHMGTRYTTYSYDTQDTKANYSAYVNNGIAMWGE